MAIETGKLLQQALTLTKEERAALVEALADSLVEDEDDPIGPEWKDEIARRIEAVERGDAHAIPGDEVEARIREALGRT